MSAVLKLREFATYAVSPAVDAPPFSSQSQMDAAVARLREGAEAFAMLSLDQRIVLVNTMQQGFLRVAQTYGAGWLQGQGNRNGYAV
jgi:hypothetical protein